MLAHSIPPCCSIIITSLPLDRRVASCVAAIQISCTTCTRTILIIIPSSSIHSQRLMVFDGRFVGVHNTIGNRNVSKGRRILQCYYLDCIERECISKIICITFYTSYHTTNLTSLYIYSHSYVYKVEIARMYYLYYSLIQA